MEKSGAFTELGHHMIVFFKRAISSVIQKPRSKIVFLSFAVEKPRKEETSQRTSNFQQFLIA